MSSIIGVSVQRKEAWDKVTGKAKYTNDTYTVGMLYARLATAQVAHSMIKKVDITKAEMVPGLKKIILGKDRPIYCGVVIEDRPALAIDRVRYFGEPVALVIALTEKAAAAAANLIEVTYESLPIISSISEALATTKTLLHDPLSAYTKVVDDVYPESGTNIASKYTINKGDLANGWSLSDIIIEEDFYLPQTDHICLETRISEAEIMASGQVNITTSSQAPFTVKELISKYFNIEEGKVHVQVPLLGGGFGGKAPVQLEILAYIASQAVNGRKVRLSNTREEDISSSPGRLSLEAKIKLGATKAGLIKAAELTYWLDTGAYTDIGPYMSKAIAVDCTGPYNIENLFCESLCIYTNHIYSTSYRGFAHESYTFCIERAIDILATACGLDPLTIRLKNALKPGNFSPTQIEITRSNNGDLPACILKLHDLINWQEGTYIDIGKNKVKAKGISCFWKTPNPPTDASAGALLTFNSDGSLNLSVAVVEMGTGGKTQLAQFVAEKLKMDVNKIHINFQVDTFNNPLYWKTVASMSSYMAGRAVLKATDDVISQLKNLAAFVLRCWPEDLEIANELVFLRHNPKLYVNIKDLVHGYKFTNGNAINGQILGRGSFNISHLTPLDPKTGKGQTGAAWTVGAQAVEVELDTQDFTYRILKAATVLDIGKLVNPKTTAASIRGGMSMGLSLASRESFIYNNQGILQTTSLRNYKLLHIGQEPLYLIDFIETPQEDAPFGCRAFSEHGIIGIPAALANALSTACKTQLNRLPLLPEYIWSSSKKQGEI